MKAFLLSLILLIIVKESAVAQTPWSIPPNIAKCYTKGTRKTDGSPGSNYWQNRADYNIQVSFDPATHQLRGTVIIDYWNNSPDTISKLQYKLYPNLYQRQAMRSVMIAPEDLGDGMKIQSLKPVSYTHLTLPTERIV